jgi:hypothetical protein
MANSYKLFFYWNDANDKLIIVAWQQAYTFTFRSANRAARIAILRPMFGGAMKRLSDM